MADAINVAKRLNALLRKKASEGLAQILDAAAGTPLKSFAESLRRDMGAIQASLDLPWTTSPVEGQINRLKMLKRTRTAGRDSNSSVPGYYMLPSKTTARKVRENL